MAVREMILEVQQIQITWAMNQLTHSFPLKGKQHHDLPLVFWHLAEMERNISQMGNQTTTRKDKDLPPDLEGTKPGVVPKVLANGPRQVLSTLQLLV